MKGRNHNPSLLPQHYVFVVCRMLLLLMVCIGLPSCKGQSVQSRAALSSNTDPSTETTSETSQPVAISGTNLLDADTAAISYQTSRSSGKNIVTAYAKYKDPKTAELLEPGGLATGFTLNWGALTDSAGQSISGSECSEVKSGDLKKDCQYSGSVVAIKLGYAIKSSAGVETAVGKDTVVPAVSSADLSLSNSKLLLTVTGTNFATAPTIKVGTQSCSSATLVSSTSITCVLADGLAVGEYNVTLQFTSVTVVVEKLFSQGPLRLASYSGASGSTTGDLTVSWVLPSNISSYASLKLRRAAGSTPPSDCSAGTLVLTRTSFTASASDSVTESLTGGSRYSYRFCISDSAGRVTSVDTISNAQAKASSGSSTYYMFVSAATVSMNMGGISAADSLCASYASMGSMSSVITTTSSGWRAMLASSTLGVRARMGFPSDLTMKNVLGATIASSEAQFFGDNSANLTSQPTIDETGNTQSSIIVATGTITTNCTEWTSNITGNYEYGNPEQSGFAWLDSTFGSCTQNAHIYCYAQTP